MCIGVQTRGFHTHTLTVFVKFYGRLAGYTTQNTHNLGTRIYHLLYTVAGLAGTRVGRGIIRVYCARARTHTNTFDIVH